MQKRQAEEAALPLELLEDLCPPGQFRTMGERWIEQLLGRPHLGLRLHPGPRHLAYLRRR